MSKRELTLVRPELCCVLSAHACKHGWLANSASRACIASQSALSGNRNGSSSWSLLRWSCFCRLCCSVSTLVLLNQLQGTHPLQTTARTRLLTCSTGNFCRLLTAEGHASNSASFKVCVQFSVQMQGTVCSLESITLRMRDLGILIIPQACFTVLLGVCTWCAAIGRRS